MFAVGHLALGYILAKSTSRALKVKVNLPIIFLLSVLPDIDIAIPDLNHRGPLHSIIIITLAFIPFFLYYKKQVGPSYVAIAQHSLVGDYLAGGGVQLLWPLTNQSYGINLSMTGQTSVLIELVCFISALIILLATKDILALMKPKKENLLLILTEVAILGSIFISWHYRLLTELLVPHLLFFAIFLASILLSLENIVLNWTRR
jgi:membrane-bound metal-dependent hydrolase YbcI (DUF457 family)